MRRLSLGAIIKKIMTRIETALDNLLIKSKGEIKSRIEEVSYNIKITDTETIGYCHCLKVDGNGNSRLMDLIEFIDEKIVEYAIPKKEIDEAQQYQIETGSPSKTIKLRKKAQALFTDLEKTGEGGEILLYILAQEFLKLPQLISKMSLKTSGQLHYQGADGVHVSYNSEKKMLNLYWGEAKMYKDLNTAITKCLESINEFLLNPLSANSVQERDIQLITANISSNINDPNLEDLLVRYFDKDDDLSNSVEYKGLCFIGFDSNEYTTNNLLRTTEEIRIALQSKIPKYHKSISEKMKLYPGLELKEIHFFLMPFPSVEDFRKYYLQEIK